MAIPWLAFAVTFAWHHWRVHRERAPAERRVDYAPASNWGLLVQVVAFAFGLATLRAGRFWLLPWAYGISAAAIALSAAALAHLGRQWRVQAVVTEDHQLITTGPYSVLRHPVYAALLLILVATLLIGGNPAASAISIALYLVGTEIRVRAEEAILHRRFGATFEAYRARTHAYLPFLR